MSHDIVLYPLLLFLLMRWYSNVSCLLRLASPPLTNEIFRIWAITAKKIELGRWKKPSIAEGMGELKQCTAEKKLTDGALQEVAGHRYVKNIHITPSHYKGASNALLKPHTRGDTDSWDVITELQGDNIKRRLPGPDHFTFDGTNTDREKNIESGRDRINNYGGKSEDRNGKSLI